MNFTDDLKKLKDKLKKEQGGIPNKYWIHGLLDRLEAAEAICSLAMAEMEQNKNSNSFYMDLIKTWRQVVGK